MTKKTPETTVNRKRSRNYGRFAITPPTELGKNLQAAMKARGLNTAAELAALTIKLGEKVVQPIISGLLVDDRVNPKFNTLERLAQALDMNVLQLLDFKKLDRTVPLALQKVPLLSWTEVSGWKKVLQNKKKSTREEIYSTIEVSKKAFALPVVGDSMAPDFIEGEIIVIDPSREPTSGDYIIAVGKAADGPILRKFAQDGSIQMLKPSNPHYPIIKMTRTSKIIGVVVSKTQNF